jgi:hypothetical protein
LKVKALLAQRSETVSNPRQSPEQRLLACYVAANQQRHYLDRFVDGLDSCDPRFFGTSEICTLMICFELRWSVKPPTFI